MNSKTILCLAFISCGILFGCSTDNPLYSDSKPSTQNLYLHIFSSFKDPEPPRLIISEPIPLSDDFDIPIYGDQTLKGHIEPRGGKFFIHFQILLCSGTNVFDGEVELEKRQEPWPQPYDAKAPFICQPHFVLSLNSDPAPFIKQQAAAEKEYHRLKNPLSAWQLAQVKMKFHRIHPGMTRDDVFKLLGIYGYHFLPTRFFNSGDWEAGDYQLAEGKRLILHFDHTGMKTIKTPAQGKDMEGFDYTSDNSHRLVISAELDTIIKTNNSSMWQATLRWP